MTWQDAHPLLTKKDFRKQAKEWLAFHQDFLEGWSRLIVENCSVQIRELKPHTIGLFYPLPFEPDLRPLKEMHPTYQWALPCLQSLQEAMEFREWSSFSLEVGPLDIRQPSAQERKINLLDLLFVPGLSFDIQKNRLGRGKGYYDFYLKNHRPKVVCGVSFDGLVFEKLPTTHHDQKVDMIITEKNQLGRHPS